MSRWRPEKPGRRAFGDLSQQKLECHFRDDCEFSRVRSLLHPLRFAEICEVVLIIVNHLVVDKLLHGTVSRFQRPSDYRETVVQGIINAQRVLSDVARRFLDRRQGAIDRVTKTVSSRLLTSLLKVLKDTSQELHLQFPKLRQDYGVRFEKSIGPNLLRYWSDIPRYDISVRIAHISASFLQLLIVTNASS